MASSAISDAPKYNQTQCKQESQSWFEEGRRAETMWKSFPPCGEPEAATTQLLESLLAHGLGGLCLISSSAKLCDLGLTI